MDKGKAREGRACLQQPNWLLIEKNSNCCCM